MYGTLKLPNTQKKKNMGLEVEKNRNKTQNMKYG